MGRLTLSPPVAAPRGAAVAVRPPTIRTRQVGAIVLGGDYRGLGVVRSLGRQGIPVWVLTDEHTVAGTSRYAARHLAWPAAGEAEQVAFLLELGRRHALDGWVLFPTGDESAALLARQHARLSEQYVLTTPPWEGVRWAYDKRLTTALATDLGLDQPWTWSPRDRDDVATGACSFPVILKPAYKVRLNSFTRAKAWRVDDRAELVARYAEACTLVDPELVIVQELIPGGGEAQFSYAALCEDGRPLASAVARRTRQHPVDFGRSSSYVETIELPAIEEAAGRLLAATRYTGVIEVEYKLDRRDGRYKLLEANPRVWGWHTLGRRAGVDFSYLLWKQALGEPVPELRARPGARWVRAVTDVPAALEEISRGRLSVAAYLRSLGLPIECAIFAADDPVPSLLEIPLLLLVAMQRWFGA